MMVANFLERIPRSAEFSTFSLSFPFKSAVLAKRFSMLPYSFRNFFAVFSPTPSKPGILSTASPIMARKSITCFGSSISYFALTSSTPRISNSAPFKPGL